MAAASSPLRIVHAVCSHDYPDLCAGRVTVDAAGRAITVQGDPTHPVTQGFLCGKVAKYLDRVYAPDRILYPLKRKAGVVAARMDWAKLSEDGVNVNALMNERLTDLGAAATFIPRWLRWKSCPLWTAREWERSTDG